LVRPIAEHDALRELRRRRRPVDYCLAHAPITSADEFVALLDTRPLAPTRIASVQAIDAAVWWEVLEQHPDLAVWVAANRTIPDEIVAHLASHPRIQVRVAVASKPGMPDATMTQLAHDKSDLVRMRVACNPKATREVLAHLVADTCVVVSRHAEARLKHDINGVMLPASYLDDLSVHDILH
jgi:hypothetical protein